MDVGKLWGGCWTRHDKQQQRTVHARLGVRLTLTSPARSVFALIDRADRRNDYLSISHYCDIITRVVGRGCIDNSTYATRQATRERRSEGYAGGGRLAVTWQVWQLAALWREIQKRTCLISELY